jgi:hypothetical protein
MMGSIHFWILALYLMGSAIDANNVDMDVRKIDRTVSSCFMVDANVTSLCPG